MIILFYNCIDQTSLIVATSYGHLDIAQLLLQYGAGVNAKNINGKLPNTCNIHLLLLNSLRLHTLTSKNCHSFYIYDNSKLNKHLSQ